VPATQLTNMFGGRAASATLVARRYVQLGRRAHLPSSLRPFTRYRPEALDAVAAGELVRPVDVGRDTFAVGDLTGSTALGSVADDLRRDAYRLADLELTPGDVVVDIGAHVGLVSMAIARRHPRVAVYALEPMPVTFLLLKRNLGRNAVANVIPMQVAVTGDGRDLHLQMWPGNTGGATGFLAGRSEEATSVDAPGATLDDLFTGLGITRCRLLKIDCEGAEHEILTTTGVLDRVDEVRAEFHINAHLEAQGHSIDALAGHVSAAVGADHLVYESCRMAD
jgi:FkbM family methyltransferase